MWKTRIIAIVVLLAGILVGYFVYGSTISKENRSIGVPSWFINYPFKLGLDLSGGSHLVYRADISQLESVDVKDSMDALRDVIERRVNLFGVSEPVVQIQEGNFANQGEERLLIDLPGVTDIHQAIELIGQTPLLEFKVENPEGGTTSVEIDPSQAVNGEIKIPVTSSDELTNSQFIATELTGRYLKHATLEFNPTTQVPIVSLQFDEKGTELFAQITADNVGKTVAIFLDGALLSAPTVQEAIPNGQAQISGNFTPQEAKQLVGRLNSGALPVPIELISTQTIGATLGAEAAADGVRAGVIGFLAVALFLIFWYRLPGVISVIALLLYISIMLAIFKLLPVTLSAAGIAGFVISIGIAVDANVLIFERIKEEIRLHGRTLDEAIKVGFSRAWFSIRDSNLSSMITAIILFWFGTSLVKGFALTFGLGVLVSLLSAISFTRLFLFALNIRKTTKLSGFLFGSGITAARKTTHL